MELERLAVNLRLRSPWEAVDLGTLLYRRWWLQIMRVWVVLYVPVAIALAAAFRETPWLAIVVLWWLKPVFDRFVLHVLSRGVFGEVPSAAETLAAWRDILRGELVAALTVRRITMRRSFDLPVVQLEGQRGAAARLRRHLLGRRAAAYAIGVTAACLHFESILMLTASALAEFFQPSSSYDTPVGFWDWIWSQEEGEQYFNLYDVAFYALAVSIIEPLYVAQGFALYLNRRTQLEGWDIELGFRRLAARLAARAATLVLVTALGAALAVQGLPAAAAEGPTRSIKEEITDIMSAPELQRHREVKRWKWKGAIEEKKPEDTNAQELHAIIAMVAEILRVLAWIAAAALAVALVYLARRYIGTLEPMRPRGYRPPGVLFGLEVRPDSLPADIPRVARALIADRRIRDAMSLLYRGALSALVHKDAVRLREGDTERDCLRRARNRLAPERLAFFSALVKAWQAAAYADRLPKSPAAYDFATGWETHFGVPTTPEERSP